MINKQLINLSSPASSGGNAGEEGLILHLDASDVDSYDGDGSEWVDIKDHEYKPTTNVSEHFNTVLWSGDGSSRSITGVRFEPDLVWIKKRNSASNSSNMLFDSVRGVDKVIITDSPQGQYDGGGTGYQTSFNTDGFSITDNGFVNQSGNTFVAWCFKAGGAPSGSDKVSIDGTSYSTMTAAGLTDGSADIVKLSINKDLGFSIAKYTGSGTASATIAHGLDTPPEMLIVKRLQNSEDWAVYHKGAGYPPEDYVLILNENTHAGDNATRWNDTAPTSTVFTVGSSQAVNAAEDYIAYSFTSKRGVSKVGGYTGANSSVFVDTGFEPAFVMIKGVSGSIGYGGWLIYDNKRDTTNPVTVFLQANTYGTEIDHSSYSISFNSTGFTVGSTQNDGINYNNNKYIYYAVAKNTNETSLIPIKEDFTAGSVTTVGTGLELLANTYSGSGNWLCTNHPATHYGVITGATYVNNGNEDYFSFDGSNDFVNTGSATRKALPMSVEMWINPTASQRGVIYSNYDTTTINGFYIRLEASRKFQIDAYNKPAGTYYRTLLDQTGSALPLNQWSHCVFTFDTSYVKIYLNGVLDTQVGTHAQGIGFTSSFDTLLAKRAGGDYFSGLIGQVRVYDSTLTPTQVKTNYDATAIYHQPDLKLNLNAASFPQLGETGYSNTPSTWTDSSGNSNNGTITGATFDSELGNYLNFDGSNDYIDCGSASNIIPAGSNFTIETWVSANNNTTNTYWSVVGAVQSGSPFGGFMIYNHQTSDNWGIALNKSGTWTSLDSGVDIEVSKWVHLAYTYDGSYMKLFVDGEERFSSSQSGSLQYAGSVNLEIGRNVSSYSPIKVGQVRAYSSALSQGQIHQNFNFTKNDYPNGYNGTISGATWNSGGYFDFDGSGDSVNLGTDLSFTINCSISLWINADTLGGNRGIMSKWAGSAPYGWIINYQGNGNIEFFFYSGSSFKKVDLGIAAVSSWHHVTITYDGNDLKGYLNGNLADTESNINFLVPNDNATNVLLCTPAISGITTQQYDGKISKVKMYDKALTSTEITALHSEGE